MKFELNYDKDVYVTLKEAEEAFGVSLVTLKSAIKEAGVVAAGTVKTGSAGKPPQVFERKVIEEALLALKDKRATAAAVKKAKSEAQTAETPQQSNDIDVLSKTA